MSIDERIKKLNLLSSGGHPLENLLSQGDYASVAQTLLEANHVELAGDLFLHLFDFDKAYSAYLEAKAWQKLAKVTHQSKSQELKSAFLRFVSLNHHSDAALKWIPSGAMDLKAALLENTGRFADAAACYEEMYEPLKA
ncbi:MAG: hypothetical protein CMH56_04285 [Myxococcales bacterium]|nr:hypothetical protein [Myxococcales bacterium]